MVYAGYCLFDTNWSNQSMIAGTFGFVKYKLENKTEEDTNFTHLKYIFNIFFSIECISISLLGLELSSRLM